jgi:hypothetical protein
MFEQHWKSKRQEALPDFIIGGAMKSGTTTLHTILDKHPDISIAHDELGFFDMDDILAHPDFNFYDAKRQIWLTQSMTAYPEVLWNWYYTQFDMIETKNKVVGEDSTTYLTSSFAAQRIALQDKPIKLIFILRHPTKRVISNYLHLLKSGRAIYSLEDTLKYQPEVIVKRSLYKSQLETYYKHIPSERIKIILFEDLITQREDCIKDVCQFLGIDFNKFQPEDLNVHSNQTKVPKYIKLQLFRNRILRGKGQFRYSRFLPIQSELQKAMPFYYKLFDYFHKKMNPHSNSHTFMVSKGTKDLLNNYFTKELEGLDDLVQMNLLSKWFKS